MTSQISNTILYRGLEYTIAGVDGDGLFDPHEVESAPLTYSSAYWRGYRGHYAIVNGLLLLRQHNVEQKDETQSSLDDHESIWSTVSELSTTQQTVHLQSSRESITKLNGALKEIATTSSILTTAAPRACTATISEESLQHSVEFTGGLLIGNGFIRDSYLHLGCHPAYKFRTIHELVFERGRLVEEHDKSQEIADLRQRLCDQHRGPIEQCEREEIEELIECCFRAKY